MPKQNAITAWRLDTPCQTLVLASSNEHTPCVIYWGAPLNGDEDCVMLAKSMARPRSGALADYTPELSICPEYGRGYHGISGIDAHDMEGRPVITQFTIETVKASTNALIFTLRDESQGLKYVATFTANQTSGIIEAETSLHSVRPMMVNFLSAPVMDVPPSTTHLIEYAGRWTQEFGERVVPISRGAHMRQSKRGRTGHDHFPAMLFPGINCSWNAGEMHAIHLGLSGSHKMLVERLSDGRIALIAGIGEPVALKAGGVIHSGKVYLGFSREGRNGLAHAFQTHVRNAIVKFSDIVRPRPVHYNCWEAVYFRHDLEELKQLAAHAHANGAERFVLDDGWFGKRDDDTSSLGDWHIDKRKFPDGLKPLIDHVEALGMKFGIWFEPEMINPDSDLARARPDWIIAPDGRETLTARNQLVLDFSNSAVTDYIFDQMDAILSNHSIDYIKWDMNRDLTLAVDKSGHGLLRRQIEAVYVLMDRLTTKYPMLEIESCASGGARIDYGILQHTHRVWLSDSNDAHERWIMQNAALQFLPPEIIGSHVGPRHCHTSGRNLSMAFRATVAASAHMGFEMDMHELNADEQSELRRWTKFYKANRALLHTGRQYRLDTPTSETIANMTVSNDKKQFILFSGSIETHRDETIQPLRLAGLDPKTLYRLKLENPEQMADRATRHFTSPLVENGPLVLSGSALCKAGLVLPFCFPQTMWVVTAHAVAQRQVR
jgi:alpha-galactosidase